MEAAGPDSAEDFDSHPAGADRPRGARTGPAESGGDQYGLAVHIADNPIAAALQSSHDR